MGTSIPRKAILAAICFAGLFSVAKGQTTWYWTFSPSPAAINWPALRLQYSTGNPFNYTTVLPWWFLTTSTAEPTTSTIPTTVFTSTEVPAGPEIIESTDTIFLILMIIACLIGVICMACTCLMCWKLSHAKKRKGRKRLIVKPWKDNQAFAQVMPPPDMGMGMGMGMGDPMGMGGMMPGVVQPPLATGMMDPMAGMGGMMDPSFGMDPNAGMKMDGMDPNAGMMGGMDPMGGQQQWFG